MISYLSDVGKIQDIKQVYVNYKKNKEMNDNKEIGEASYIKKYDGDYIPFRMRIQRNCV